MTEIEFWRIIDDNARPQSSNRGEIDTRAIEEHLVTLPIEEICSFQRWVEKAHEVAHTDRLWGAAYLMNGGCSDDGFYDFVGWLISRGSHVYSSVAKSADDLADFGYGEDLDFLRHAYDAAKRIGHSIDDTDFKLDEITLEAVDQLEDAEAPDDFDDDDAMEQAYPKCWAAYQAAIQEVTDD